MATIASATSSSYENTSRRSYISTDTFEYDFWSYTTSVDTTTYVTTGTLSLIPAAAGVCPRGRVLRETGRKLVPGANPGITVYMVEVFDNVTFLRGYINPNSPVFAPFNSDKPAFMEEPYVINQDVSGGSYGAPGAFAGLQNLGSSVVTRGNINADGYIETGGQIRCSQQVFVSEATPNNDINVALGQVFHRNVGGNVTLTASNYTIGDRVTLYLIFTVPATTTYTVTFNAANFRTIGGSFAVTNATGASVTSTYSISFICANTAVSSSASQTLRLVETSRTLALV